MKTLAIPISIIVLFLFGLSILVYQTKNSSYSSISPQKTTSPTTSAQISLTPDYEIKLKAPNQTISAIALRITYHFGDQNISKPSFKINSLITEDDWSFPINEIVIDDINNTLTIDLAAVKLSPEGHKVEDNIILGTLSFAGDPPPIDKFVLDTNLTKIITKSGEELALGMLD